jgi:hypothetical protein
MMDTLGQLQQSLQRELPFCTWHCHPASDAQTISSSEVSSEIEITAMISGKPVEGSPFHVGGNVLSRWGADATARFICSGLAIFGERASPGSSGGWDKLAEL